MALGDAGREGAPEPEASALGEALGVEEEEALGGADGDCSVEGDARCVGVARSVALGVIESDLQELTVLEGRGVAEAAGDGEALREPLALELTEAQGEGEEVGCTEGDANRDAVRLPEAGSLAKRGA